MPIQWSCSATTTGGRASAHRAIWWARRCLSTATLSHPRRGAGKFRFGDRRLQAGRVHPHQHGRGCDALDGAARRSEQSPVHMAHAGGASQAGRDRRRRPRPALDRSGIHCGPMNSHLYKSKSERFRKRFLDQLALSRFSTTPRGFRPNAIDLEKPLIILMSMAGLLVAHMRHQRGDASFVARRRARARDVDALRTGREAKPHHLAIAGRRRIARHWPALRPGWRLPPS